MASGGRTQPAYSLPKPQHVKTAHSISRPSAPKPKASAARPREPGSGCCGKRA